MFAPADGRMGLVLKVVRGVMAYVSGRIAKLSPDSIRLETPAAVVGVRGTTLAHPRRSRNERARDRSPCRSRSSRRDWCGAADRSRVRTQARPARTWSCCSRIPTTARSAARSSRLRRDATELARGARVDAGLAEPAAGAGRRHERGRRRSSSSATRLSALPPPPQHFTCYFRFESDELTDESRALVPEILQAVRIARSRTSPSSGTPTPPGRRRPTTSSGCGAPTRFAAASSSARIDARP